jgi:hypothetical protein
MHAVPTDERRKLAMTSAMRWGRTVGEALSRALELRGSTRGKAATTLAGLPWRLPFSNEHVNRAFPLQYDLIISLLEQICLSESTQSPALTMQCPLLT